MKESVLTTDRLSFYTIKNRDFDWLKDLFTDPIAMRYFPGIKTDSEIVEWINRVKMLCKKQGFGLWSVQISENKQNIGYCGLIYQEDVDGTDEIEIAYGLIRRYWHNGYASEAARAVRDYAVTKLGYDRLISLVDKNNTGSKRVAASMGMKIEKTVTRWGKKLDVWSINY